MMISVVTITYQRHHLLEEAIQSFLEQDYTGPSEMVIVNDSPDVRYVINHPKIRIYNLDTRFDSITTKLKWGCEKAEGEFIYRLDDDDLLAPWALSSVADDIEKHPGHDIYRSSNQYFFVDNKFQKISSNINNGNVYSKAYLNRIKWPNKESGEDHNITFGHNGKIYESRKAPTMLYRWGMNTFHVSGKGKRPNDHILKDRDLHIKHKETGVITLSPEFLTDYYKQLPIKKPS